MSVEQSPTARRPMRQPRPVHSGGGQSTRDWRHQQVEGRGTGQLRRSPAGWQPTGPRSSLCIRGEAGNPPRVRLPVAHHSHRELPDVGNGADRLHGITIVRMDRDEGRPTAATARAKLGATPSSGRARSSTISPPAPPADGSQAPLAAWTGQAQARNAAPLDAWPYSWECRRPRRWHPPRGPRKPPVPR